jgi:hypothetical protein
LWPVCFFALTPNENQPTCGSVCWNQMLFCNATDFIEVIVAYPSCRGKSSTLLASKTQS